MKKLTLATALGMSLVFGMSSVAQAQALTPIKISYQPSLYWALPFHIATEKGWWKEVGLAPEARARVAAARAPPPHHPRRSRTRVQ